VDVGSEDHTYTILDTELEILLALIRESGKVGLREVYTLAGAEGSVVESLDLDVRPGVIGYLHTQSETRRINVCYQSRT